MIGLSVTEILKLLDQIPIWKSLAALPKRLRELEERVAVLEAKPAQKSGPACPVCAAPMKTTKVEPDEIFGVAGLQRHTLVCPDCGHQESRQVDPRKP